MIVPWPQTRTTALGIIRRRDPRFAGDDDAESKGPNQASGWARLARDRRGATAVELALVAFPFFALILLILEIGLVYWVGAALDNGLQVSMRQIYIGGINGQGSLVDKIRKQISDSSAGLIGYESVKVDLAAYARFSDVALVSPVDPATQEWRPGFGGQHGCPAKGGVIVVQAALAQQTFNRLGFGKAAFKDGSGLIQSAAVIQIDQPIAGAPGC